MQGRSPVRSHYPPSKAFSSEVETGSRQENAPVHPVRAFPLQFDMDYFNLLLL